MIMDKLGRMWYLNIEEIKSTEVNDQQKVLLFMVWFTRWVYSQKPLTTCRRHDSFV